MEPVSNNVHLPSDLKTGDLLFLSTSDCGGCCIRCCTLNRFDHIAVILRDGDNALYTLECTTSQGVVMYRLQDRVNDSIVYSAAVRRLSHPLDFVRCQAVAALHRDLKGREYKSPCANWLQMLCCWCFYDKTAAQTKRREAAATTRDEKYAASTIDKYAIREAVEEFDTMEEKGVAGDRHFYTRDHPTTPSPFGPVVPIEVICEQLDAEDGLSCSSFTALVYSHVGILDAAVWAFIDYLPADFLHNSSNINNTITTTTNNNNDNIIINNNNNNNNNNDYDGKHQHLPFISRKLRLGPLEMIM